MAVADLLGHLQGYSVQAAQGQSPLDYLAQTGFLKLKLPA
jgi:hypothetical protein